ncbi:MAG: helix-turn-helix domain-containing protein, partial [Methylocella sp.]
AAKLEQAKRYIGLHLSDPELTPEKAAGALNMSVRQLQRLFEPSGTGFAQYLLLRRLQECRAALTSPIGADRSVTDIAFAWGFNSLATFYRTFRRSFGAAPNELRAAAPGRHGLRHDLAGAEKTQRQKSATT